MLDLPFRSAKQLAGDIRKRKIGCLELTELYLARIEKYGSALNAVVVRNLGGARPRARAADRAGAKGQAWGRSAEREELVAKFRRLAEVVLPPERFARLPALLRALADLPDVAELAALGAH